MGHDNEQSIVIYMQLVKYLLNLIMFVGHSKVFMSAPLTLQDSGAGALNIGEKGAVTGLRGQGVKSQQQTGSGGGWPIAL